ncbi:MAG: MBL fold metallo-hydrolase [Candidatus Lokiarchaeota archaeon]
MKISNNHFSVFKEQENLYIIKENISLVHDAYRNDPLNIYLILGTDKALLVDTGCGLYPLRPIIDGLRKDRELIVLNTHFHWDHVLGNREFEEVKIHTKEIDIVSYPYDISFFKSSTKDEVKKYEKYNYLIPPAKNVSGLKDGDILNLGGSNVEVIHTLK